MPEMSLAQWLASLEDPDEDFWTWAFPNDDARDSYLDSIANRSEAEVRGLLRRFLLANGSLGRDEARLDFLEYLAEHNPGKYEAATKKEFTRRLLDSQETGEGPWEGTTWVLDLIPRWPMRAIEVLESYLLAHFNDLPDGRIHSPLDSQALIRAMWIGNPGTATEKRDVVFQLGPRRFEHLIERLYDAMGYETSLTPQSRDGGRDVEVIRDQPGKRERAIVECKLSRGSTGVPVVRAVLGVAAHAGKVWSKSVVVCAGSFTRDALKFAAADPRLELIDWSDLLLLLDEHLGASWARNVDRLIAASIQKFA